MCARAHPCICSGNTKNFKRLFSMIRLINSRASSRTLFTYVCGSLDSFPLTCKAMSSRPSSSKAFIVCKFGIFMRSFLEDLTILLGLGIILSIVTLVFLEVLAVSHFNSRLPLCFCDTVVQDQGVLVLNRKLAELLVNQCFNFLENFDVILGYKCDSFASFASPSCTTNTVYVVF